MERRNFFSMIGAFFSLLLIRPKPAAAVAAGAVLPDGDRRYRIFQPGDVYLAKKPPDILYVPTVGDMQFGSLTEETDDTEEFELLTREEGLAAVADFNADVLANWDEEESPAVNDWAMLIEVGTEPVARLVDPGDNQIKIDSVLGIYLDGNGTGYEDRSFHYSVRLVQPTPAERARYAIAPCIGT